LSPATRAVQVGQSAQGKIKAWLTYQQAMYYFLSIFGEVTATGGPAYVWTYTAPDAAVPTTYGPQTFEYGQTDASYELAGGMIHKAKITIEPQKPWIIEADLFGKKVAAAAMTGALSDTAGIVVVRAADTTVYMDAWDGTLAATEFSAQMIKAELNIDTKRHLKDFVSASLYPTNFGEAVWSGTLKTTVEFSATSKAMIDAVLTPGVSQKMWVFKATSGSAIMQIDFAGTLTGMSELFKTRDGNMIMELTWSGTRGSTTDDWLRATVTNAVATIV
jgi:hypothetical protein